MVVENLYYTKDHEWAQINGEIATVGITDYAQQALGEITFVELPQTDKQVNVHDILATAESSKAASDIYSPMSGTVTEINNEISAKPELINQDCYKAGWICKLKISNPADKDKLMNAGEYEKYLGTL